MTYEEYKRAKAMVATKQVENWMYAYSLDIFKKKHPKKALAYDERIKNERNSCGKGSGQSVKSDKEKIKEIMSIENWEERHKAIAENMHLFNQWTRVGRRVQEYTGRSVAEMQKRSEIMNIKDIDMRQRAIAENMHLFEN